MATHAPDPIPMMTLAGSYKTIDVAVYVGDSCQARITDEGTRASSSLIPTIDAVLNAANIPLHTLSAIAVDQGPGAFTSLRVTITTANAISYASGIPLIGVDGLDALAHHVRDTTTSYIAVLLNAFNHEVYVGLYAIKGAEHLTPLIKNYGPITHVLEQIKDVCAPGSLLLVGNGVEIYHEQIQKILGDSYKTLTPNPAHADATMIAHMAAQVMQKDRPQTTKLTPLYLKSQHFAIRE